MQTIDIGPNLVNLILKSWERMSGLEVKIFVIVAGLAFLYWLFIKK